MEDTISLKDIFYILKKRWKLIISSVLVAVVISAGLSYYVLIPVYQASTQILVNQKDSENQLDISQIDSNLGLINTYSVIIKSPAILEKVINNLNLKESVDQLNQKVMIYSQENSQVFSLTVQDNNAERAVKIANSVSETFQKDILEIMNVDNVKILAKAELTANPTPVKPNIVLNIVIATIVGLIIGIGWTFLLEYLDNSIQNTQEVEALLALPVLGTIQSFSGKQKTTKKFIN